MGELGTFNLKVNYVKTTWDVARRAYVAQLGDPASAPTLLAWVLGAIDDHAARSPAERAAAASGSAPAGVERIERVHRVDRQVLERIEAARDADRVWDPATRLLSRTAWINEAVDVAARTVERERGPLPEVGALPPGPRGPGGTN